MHIAWILYIIILILLYIRANWLIVEYAITFLISCWNKPIRELNTVVIAPNHIQNNNTVEPCSINGDERINKYTPAVTIVAACINADTGVGVYNYILFFLINSIIFNIDFIRSLDKWYFF